MKTGSLKKLLAATMALVAAASATFAPPFGVLTGAAAATFFFRGLAVQAGEILNEQGHFSIDLPSGWILVPSQRAKDFVREAERVMKRPLPEFSFAYQPAPPDDVWFQYPYCIGYIAHSGHVNEASVLQFVGAQDVNSQTSVKLPDQQLLTNGSMGSYVYDASRHILWQSMHLVLAQPVAGERDVSGMSAKILTADGYIKLRFYALASQYQTLLPTFQKMAESVKPVGAPYMPIGVNPVHPSATVLFENTWVELTTSVFLLASLGVWIATRKKGIKTVGDNRHQRETKKDADSVDISRVTTAASNRRRVFAFLIDSAMGLLLVWFLSVFVDTRPDSVQVALIFAFTAFLIIRDSIIRGGSIGKQLCGVVLIDESTGLRLGRVEAAIRQLGLYMTVYIVGFLGYFLLGYLETGRDKRLTFALFLVATILIQQAKSPRSVGDKWIGSVLLDTKDYEKALR